MLRRRCEKQGTGTDLAITEKFETEQKYLCINYPGGWWYYLSIAHMCSGDEKSNETK